MSTRSHPTPHRFRWRPARAAALGVSVLVILGAAFVADRLIVSSNPQTPAVRFVARPDLSWRIAGLVTGSARQTPGVAAYVEGARGTWQASFGVANVNTGAPMRPEARMRIESLSKLFVATVVLQLVQEGKLGLDDAVAKWLPGLLPYGGKVTLRELMTDSSGLIDDNDLTASPAAARRYLARVKDPTLRAQLAGIVRQLNRDPAAVISPMWIIRLAAGQPLLFSPGSRTRHSNIGWNIVGLIAAKATGKPLPAVYQERIFGDSRSSTPRMTPKGRSQGHTRTDTRSPPAEN